MWVYWLILFWSVCVCADPICHPSLIRAVHWLPSKSHLLPSLPDDRKTRQGDIRLALDDFWVQNSWLCRACTTSSGSAAGNPPPCRLDLRDIKQPGAGFWWLFVHPDAGSLLSYWPALQPQVGSCGVITGWPRATGRRAGNVQEGISSFLWEKGWFQPHSGDKC